MKYSFSDNIPTSLYVFESPLLNKLPCFMWLVWHLIIREVNSKFHFNQIPMPKQINLNCEDRNSIGIQLSLESIASDRQIALNYLKTELFC